MKNSTDLQKSIYRKTMRNRIVVITILIGVFFSSCKRKPDCSSTIISFYETEISILNDKVAHLEKQDSIKSINLYKKEQELVDYIINENNLLNNKFSDFIDWLKKTERYQTNFSRYQEQYFFSKFIDNKLIGKSNKNDDEQLLDLFEYHYKQKSK